ncbi:MAG: carbohydrate ABC transporter permease [Treponema sp.]|jgi:putative aldouronate transport system permease protein|nr:carbohydrate ABC transporter permease [Treponema sp.]
MAKGIWGRKTPEDIVFAAATNIFVLFVVFVTLYPFIFIASASISNASAVTRMEVWLLPKGINFGAYRRVFRETQLWISYRNTIWYVAVGTTVNLIMTTLLAYPLSRRRFQGRRFLMIAITFTMFFSGGMIPSFILVRSLGLINTRWALVIPSAISTYNLIVTRTFFENIPESLHEMATIDGAGEFRIFVRIFLPLSLPILGTLVLFYAVGHWNTYFNAMLYLSRDALYPLQIFLRKILLQYEANDLVLDIQLDRNDISQTIRYATIMISTLPIICVYPFLQKYFVKGVMIGAIKG